MVQQLLTGPAPQVQPTLAGSGQSSSLEMTVLNQRNASALNELAGGFKGRKSTKRRSRRSRRSKKRTARGSKKYKKGRKLTRRTRNKRSRLYKGGSNPIPYSAPAGSNAAVLNISEELALAHATSNLNAKLDGAATNAPNK
jgi:hypothetical protein